MISPKYAPILFSAILSGLMSLIVSAISTVRIVGIEPAFVWAWMGSWVVAWAIAFPTVSVIAPMTRKIVERVTARPIGVRHTS
jgi:hypothetical protein